MLLTSTSLPQKVVRLPGGISIAAYAIRHPAQRHFAYAKAFVGTAIGYWDVTDCFAKFGSERDHADADSAIEDVLQVALMSLMNLGCAPLAARGEVPPPAGAA